MLAPTEQQESTPEADTARGVADTAPVRSPDDKCSGSRSRSLSTPEQKKITARKRSGILCLLSSALLEQDRPDASGTNHGARHCYLCQNKFFPLELEDNKFTRDFPRVPSLPTDEAASRLVTQLAVSQHGVSRHSCSQRRLLSESQLPKASPGVTEVKAIKFVPRRPKTSPALRSWHGALPKSMPRTLWGRRGVDHVRRCAEQQ